MPTDWRKYDLKKRYGITLSDYERMLEQQGGCCKICGCDSPGNKRDHFSVDHSHKTKEIRGLLCHHCNTGLGYFRDSPEALGNAIIYLEEAEAKCPASSS